MENYRLVVCATYRISQYTESKETRLIAICYSSSDLFHGVNPQLLILWLSSFFPPFLSINPSGSNEIFLKNQTVKRKGLMKNCIMIFCFSGKLMMNV